MMLSSETDGLVRFIATADGQPIGPPLIHTWSCVGWAAISAAGDRFATSAFDRQASPMGSTASTCQIFDLATGRPTTPMLPHTNWPARLAFSPTARSSPRAGLTGPSTSGTSPPAGRWGRRWTPARSS